eukprot:gene12456-8544_t
MSFLWLPRCKTNKQTNKQSLDFPHNLRMIILYDNCVLVIYYGRKKLSNANNNNNNKYQQQQILFPVVPHPTVALYTTVSLVSSAYSIYHFLS